MKKVIPLVLVVLLLIGLAIGTVSAGAIEDWREFGEPSEEPFETPDPDSGTLGDFKHFGEPSEEPFETPDPDSGTLGDRREFGEPPAPITVEEPVNESGIVPADAEREGGEEGGGAGLLVALLIIVLFVIIGVIYYNNRKHSSPK